MELFVSGTGLAADFYGVGARDATLIPVLAVQGDAGAQAALDRHADRLARALASVTNLLDPDAIVLGGGLSNLPHLYEVLPALMQSYIFSDVCAPNIVRAKHGDSSGVRGAAWLWPKI